MRVVPPIKHCKGRERAHYHLGPGSCREHCLEERVDKGQGTTPFLTAPRTRKALRLCFCPCRLSMCIWCNRTQMWPSGTNLPSRKRSEWTSLHSSCEAEFYRGRLTQRANRHMNLLDRTLRHAERWAGILCSPLKQIGAVKSLLQKHWLQRLR